jgi:adenine-specific DNA-methyltransferase
VTAGPLFPYMGTKRALAPRVASAARELNHRGVVADLFCGTGAVAVELAQSDYRVVANDNLEFIAALQRGQLLPLHEGLAIPDVDDLIGRASIVQQALARRLHTRIRREDHAVKDGPDALLRHMDRCTTVSNSAYLRNKRRTGLSQQYDMISDYFGSTYFAVEQAMWLDALRQAIDETCAQRPATSIVRSASTWDVAIAAWLLTAHSIANTTGHGAQYLKPTVNGYHRVLRAWARPVTEVFRTQLGALLERRERFALSGNAVTASGARHFFDLRIDGLAIAYLDPPYTKDHYSRMYHLHETIYLYDNPEIAGAGLARVGRAPSEFSTKRTAQSALANLLARASMACESVILSYPVYGLIQLELSEWRAFTSRWFKHVEVQEFDLHYSTLGAKSGARNKRVTERLFLLN